MGEPERTLNASLQQFPKKAEQYCSEYETEEYDSSEERDTPDSESEAEDEDSEEQERDPNHVSEKEVIVKLASIYLILLNPNYQGGSWHTEGQINEYICSTALFYFDNESITDSYIDFRTVANAKKLDDPAIPIISTANMPPQREDWWPQELERTGDLPFDDEIAKEFRRELMEERSANEWRANDKIKRAAE
ncbi:WD40 repeat-like-containing protein [Fusarium napiforme]|uniref:WD40 repeat-like-containing protein n=1 Tax=Fusarium napiforme TaxID=42672 RepID=A0A8H5I469_9HYPO|nr:WD40 repeat-like-containing protein [Fusarium napiforme]